MSGSSGGERFAQLHVGAVAVGAPVIFIDAVAHEHHAEALGEGGRGRRIGQRVRDSSQGSAMATAGAAQHRAAGERGIYGFCYSPFFA